MKTKPKIGEYVYIARLNGDTYSEMGVIGHKFHVHSYSHSGNQAYPHPHESSIGGCWDYRNLEYVNGPEPSSNYEIF